MKKYRLNALGVIINPQGKVLVCARNDVHPLSWQFPQGGIEKEESPKAAVLREVFEETHISSLEVIAQASKSFAYDFPPEVMEKFAKMKKSKPHMQIFDGQEQFAFLLKFYGDEKEIDLTDGGEFSDWKWVEMPEAVAKIVDFKKEVYQAVYQEFLPYIEKIKKSA